MVTRGFTGRGSDGGQSDRIPPGQHLVDNFPVLTAGPTPSVEPSDWKFTVKIGPKPIKVWNWVAAIEGDIAMRGGKIGLMRYRA